MFEALEMGIGLEIVLWLQLVWFEIHTRKSRWLCQHLLHISSFAKWNHNNILS